MTTQPQQQTILRAIQRIMERVDQTLERIEKQIILADKNALTVKELSVYLNLTEDRIRHLTADRQIPHYKQGNRLYFKKSEIEAWQLSRQVPTDSELKVTAATRSALRR